CQPKEEAQKVPALLARLREQAAQAGGPAPAPQAPALDEIDAIDAQSGNAQLLALYTQQEALVAKSLAWVQTAQAIASRLPAWRQLNDLLNHARGLGPAAELLSEVQAIEAQRSLLADPDPVRPLLDQTVQ